MILLGALVVVALPLVFIVALMRSITWVLVQAMTSWANRGGS